MFKWLYERKKPEMPDQKKIQKLKQQLKKVTFFYLPYHTFRKYLEKKRNDRKIKNLQTFGYQVMNDLYSALSQTDWKVFCVFGTLLGFVRDGDFIQFDNDIDIGILQEENFSWDELEKAMDTIHMKRIRQFSKEGKITEQTYGNEQLTVDFFGYVPVQDEMQSYEYFRDPAEIYQSTKDFSIRVWKSPMLKGIETKKINGVNILMPTNSEEYLESVYGSSWRVPDPDYDPDLDGKLTLKGKLGHCDLFLG